MTLSERLEFRENQAVGTAWKVAFSHARIDLKSTIAEMERMRDEKKQLSDDYMGDENEIAYEYLGESQGIDIALNLLRPEK